MDLTAYVRSLALFVVAGLLEIGGGYLVWLWLRDGRGILLGAIGGLILFLYGVIPTLQPSTFGRTYAAFAFHGGHGAGAARAESCTEYVLT